MAAQAAPLLGTYEVRPLHEWSSTGGYKYSSEDARSNDGLNEASSDSAHIAGGKDHPCQGK